MDPSVGSATTNGGISLPHVFSFTAVVATAVKVATSTIPSQTAATTSIDNEPLDCGDSVEGDECNPGVDPPPPPPDAFVGIAFVGIAFVGIAFVGKEIAFDGKDIAFVGKEKEED